MPFEQFDLGKAATDAERIKIMRNQNALAEFSLGNTRQFNALAPQIAGGDYAAYQEGMGVDPTSTLAIRKAGAAQESDSAVQFARLAKFVLDQPPEARPQAWLNARAEAGNIFGVDISKVPEEYDEGKLQAIYARAVDPKAVTAVSGPGKVAADITAGFLPEGTPLRAPKGAGTSLSVTPEGGITFSQGGARIPAGPGLSKPVQGAVEKAALASSEGLARLRGIQGSFKPEFMETGTRFKQAWNAKLEKFGQPLSPDDQQSLTEYTTFSRKALSNLNDYIKEITGAALSEMEAKRIMAAAPNPGQGIFDGDSPTQFKAKMDAAMEELELANARAVYAARNGLNALDVSLEKTRSRINRRYSTVYEDNIDAGMNEATAKKAAVNTINQEFGLDG